MRGLFHLFFITCLGLSSAWGQVGPSPLVRRVRLTPGTRSLGAVLAELSRQSGLPFSYSSSRVPVARSCTVPPGAARSLRVVLGEVLAKEQLAYGLLDGQLVLWPSSQPIPAGVTEVNGVDPAPARARADLTAGEGTGQRPNARIPDLSRPKASGGTISHPSAAVVSGRPPAHDGPPTAPEQRSPARRAAPDSGTSVAGEPTGNPALAAKTGPGVPASKLPAPRGAGIGRGPRPRRVAAAYPPAAGLPMPSARPGPTGRPGFPLAGLGPRPVPLHLDSAGLGHRPRLVAPVAIAPGVAPEPKPPARPFHFVVLAPLRDKGAPLPVSRYGLNLLVGHSAGVRKAEVGGLANLVRDTVRGVQLAGLLNASGTVNGGVQLAGVANLNRGSVRGVQGAALLNVVRRDMRGLQFGLVNVARHVHGVQLGLLNLADSVDGVSLGLINLVRHGYLHGEVWASESLPLNAVAKLGVRPFYTLVGVAAEPFGNRVEWATGAGLGTASRPYGRLSYSLDLVQWFLAGGDEEGLGQRFFTQLRPALVWQIERAGRLQLVAGPSLNLAVARRAGGPDRWTFGENQWLWAHTVNERNILRLWPGVQLGLRF